MCKFFEVSRSGYYDFVKRIGQREQDADLAEKIQECQNKTDILHLFNAAKLAGEDLTGSVGIMDLVPNDIVTVTLCFYLTTNLKGQNGSIGCS